MNLDRQPSARGVEGHGGAALPGGRAAAVEERPVLIVGCQRSGTTLVRDMCNRHPHIDVMPETHLMPLLWKQHGALVHLGRVGLGSWLRATLPKVNPAWQREDLRRTLETVIERFQEDALRRGDACLADAPNFFSEWLEHWRAATGVSRAGEKTPSHVYYLPSLLRSIPAAQAIVMHRDPRAAGCSEWRKHQSIHEVGRRFTWYRFAVRWASSVAVAGECEQTFGPERVLQLRYEDVAAAPADAARRICSFLREPYDPSMVDVQNRNTSFTGGGRGTPDGIDDVSIDRWRRELDSHAVARLEDLTASAMKSVGYQCEAIEDRAVWSWRGPSVRAMAAFAKRDPATFNQLASRGRYPGLRPRDQVLGPA